MFKFKAKSRVSEEEWHEAADTQFTCFCCGKHYQSAVVSPVFLMIRDNIRYPVDFTKEYFAKGILDVLVCPECMLRLRKTRTSIPTVKLSFELAKAEKEKSPSHAENIYRCYGCLKEYWGYHRDNGFMHYLNSNYIRYIGKDPKDEDSWFFCPDCMRIFLEEIDKIQKENNYTPPED